MVVAYFFWATLYIDVRSYAMTVCCRRQQTTSRVPDVDSSGWWRSRQRVRGSAAVRCPLRKVVVAIERSTCTQSVGLRHTTRGATQRQQVRRRY